MKALIERILLRISPVFRVIYNFRNQVQSRFNTVEKRIETVEKLIRDMKSEMVLQSGNAGISFESLDALSSQRMRRYYYIIQYIKENDSILDLYSGFGYGAYLLATRSSCKNVTAIETDPHIVSRALIVNNHDKILYLNRLPDQLFMNEESVDIVCCMDPVKNMQFSMDILRLLLNAVKSKGLIFIAIPGPSNPVNKEQTLKIVEMLDNLCKEEAVESYIIFSQLESANIIENHTNGEYLLYKILRK